MGRLRAGILGEPRAPVGAGVHVAPFGVPMAPWDGCGGVWKVPPRARARAYGRGGRSEQAVRRVVVAASTTWRILCGGRRAAVARSGILAVKRGYLAPAWELTRPSKSTKYLTLA